MKTLRIPKPKKIGYEADPILAKQNLLELVKVLNRTQIKVSTASNPGNTRIRHLELTPQQVELRRLVEKWRKSGPNLTVMFRREPELARRTKFGRTTFWPTETGRGYLDWEGYPAEGAPESLEDRALCDFMTLITNPNWELLGGPCFRCGDYYLKKARRRSKYCSRRCSSRETASVSTGNSRKKQHAEKICRAQEQIDEWCKTKRRETWKVWVSRKTNLTSRWLTRAEHNGKIKPPQHSKQISGPATSRPC
jgi:hypothetical protein